MAKAKFTTGAQALGETCSTAADLQRILDLIVSRAGTWKSRIEDVQCTAVDARLTQMESEVRQDQEGARTARQHIADELSSIVDDIETLLAELRIVAVKTERCRLQ